MWKRILLPVVLLAGVGLGVLSAGPARPSPLFEIARSKNANVVRYDLRLGRNGFYDPRAPLDVYWVMRADDGHREELTQLERKVAYGYEVLPGGSASELRIRLVALKSRPLSIRKAQDGYRPELPIAGIPARLDRVYVATREDGVLPKILHVDLEGRGLADERPVRERLTSEK